MQRNLDIVRFCVIILLIILDSMLLISFLESTTAKEKILQIAKNEKIDGIVDYASDLAFLTFTWIFIFGTSKGYASANWFVNHNGNDCVLYIIYESFQFDNIVNTGATWSGCIFCICDAASCREL